MTQPKFAPIQIEDQVRDAYRLRTPDSWAPDRPADFRAGGAPHGKGFGTAGPDQGYALHLVHHFDGRLQLSDGESEEDVVAAAVAIAMRRAAAFGRAPVLADLESAFTLTGCLGSPPAELVVWRAGALRGVAHDGWAEVQLVSVVPASTLRLSPASLAERLGEWRTLLGLEA
jgi:hypothetical protein